MARTARTPSNGQAPRGNAVALAVAAVPFVLNLLKELNTPENREQLKEWAATADDAIRKMTTEGRVDTRIAVVRAHLAKLPPSQSSTDRTGSWTSRLSKIEDKRALLRGSSNASARRKHLKALSAQLDALWAEIVDEE